MRIPPSLILAILGLGAWFPGVARAQGADDVNVRKAVVKITATLRPPDVFRPWAKTSPRDATGSGVVIDGKRILTSAHMVTHAAQIFIQPDNSSEKLPATIEAIAPGIDLALLKMQDQSFFDNHPPLNAGDKLPGLQQTVFAYGFPEGGSELSITRGIVSRIEYADYNMLTYGLRIQVDAAINPGNSGGPAVIDGQMIGLVFRKLSEADNIGYIIPMEEITLFLKDVKDGHYDGKPVFIDETQALDNEALREKLRIDKNTTGIVVRRIAPRTAPYPLLKGDVITRIGDHSVDNLGMVQMDRNRLVRFQYLIQRLAKDNKAPMTVVRDGRVIKFEVPVGPEHDRWLIPYLGGDYPSYFIYGPLVFTDLTDDYVRALTQGLGDRVSIIMSSLYAGNPMFLRYGDRPAFPGERLVLIGHPMFNHKISQGYHASYTAAIAEINGVRIRNLKHMVEVLRDGTDPFVEFTFHGKNSDAIVFKRKAVQDATEEILNDNGIRQQCSPDIAPLWQQAKKTNQGAAKE
jgi:S1-C subfamily serine protease